MTNSEMAKELREAMMVYTAVHGKETEIRHSGRVFRIREVAQ